MASIELTLILVLIIVLPNIPPEGSFTSFKVNFPELTGPLALNQKLNNASRWLQDRLKGPETFAEFNGELYTGLLTGQVVKITADEEIVPIVRFGDECQNSWEEDICGRPLGLTIDKNGVMYVADAYKGLWKYNIKSGQKTLLVEPEAIIDGKKSFMINSVVVTKAGEIFWSHSSTEFNLYDGIYTLLADGTGRLMQYNSSDGSNRVLIDNIQFANGLALSSAEDFILMNNCGQSKIHRYHLKGPKMGSSDVFVEDLPGLPDNVQPDGKGGFLVALVIASDSKNPAPNQSAGPLPLVRKFVAKFMGIVDETLQLAFDYLQNPFFKRLRYLIGSLEAVPSISPDRATIVQISNEGKIMGALHGDNRQMHGISEAFVFKDTLYLGSPFNSYAGKIALTDVGLDHLATD